MAKLGSGFEETLAEAQKLGYAEADPGADVDGHDAAYKISILGSLFLGKRVRTEEVFREGIRKITHSDIRYADELGYTIKLLGIAKNAEGDRLDIRVHPTMIPKSHPLSSVSGVTNAIAVRGDAVGEVMFIGPGAGRMPTASAVVADILNAASSLGCIEPLMTCHHTHSVDHLSIEDISSRYYIRLLTEDRPGVLGRLGMAFAEHGVSIHYFMQKEAKDGQAVLVIVTHRVPEHSMRAALAAITEHNDIREVANVIRVEEE
jgi:homoserine dehydrogenase